MSGHLARCRQAGDICDCGSAPNTSQQVASSRNELLLGMLPATTLLLLRQSSLAPVQCQCLLPEGNRHQPMTQRGLGSQAQLLDPLDSVAGFLRWGSTTHATLTSQLGRCQPGAGLT